jgi:diaminohydroxyphosphoribosylaminopyrimidine deaminase/5-amino-6-(5-phosphoribosylamino)uracil reductase
MRLALSLAERGAGRVNPNPMVGAVIVKDGRIIGQGWHEKFGGPHAERNGLAACTETPAGATLYVTLEPCCHHGKTPPCTDVILESGIRRVVIGSKDPNPLVCGKGTDILRANGVEVTESVLREACDGLNRAFFHFIQTKTPYVTMKYAMTMDGKIATDCGASRWITGEAAREQVHRDRRRNAAVMVGVGTVLSDDPQLTCRIPDGRNPLRIVCDTHLRTPLAAGLVVGAAVAGTLIATAVTDAGRHAPYLAAGCSVIVVPEADGHIDLRALMRALGGRGIDSILLEGGGALNWSALKSGIVRRVQAYVAPKLFGGHGKTPVGGTGVTLPDGAFFLSPPVITRLGDDILLESEVLPCSRES